MKKLSSVLAGLLISISIYSQTSWSLTGNAGTTNSNFLGTTDNTPLIIKVNNRWAGFTGYQDKMNVSFGYNAQTNAFAEGRGNANSAFGVQALQWNREGEGNVAIGTWALEWCTEGDYNVALGLGAMGNSRTVGNHNVALGQTALFNNKQSGNTAVGSAAAYTNTEGLGITAVGYKALCSNTTGDFNTALGYNALLFNTTGYWNVALGSGSLQWNRTGRFNTAGGNSSLHFNTTGVENTAFGEQALGGNIEGNYNTAVGCRSLWSVLYTPGVGDSGYGQGDCNTAVGYESLKTMTTGGFNVGVGLRSLYTNNTGNENAAVGNYTLANNTSGSKNTVIGNQALTNNTTGSENTAIGYGANVGKGTLSNATAIGYNATATSSNQVRIGDGNVTSIGGTISWSTLSDKRVNSNIRNNVPGLAFINRLQAVTFNIDFESVDKLYKSGITKTTSVDSLQILQQMEKIKSSLQGDRSYIGFIAQDVEKTAKDMGFDFSAVDVDENGIYSLRYAKFVVPLVKAIQELSELEAIKDEVIALMQEQLSEMSKIVDMLLEKESSTGTGINNTITSVSLEQNFPNPFNQSTTIKYNLPVNCQSAKIVINDMSGKMHKQIHISGSGAGSVTIEAGSFTAGTYFYSLFVDNNKVDTKKMILTK